MLLYLILRSQLNVSHVLNNEETHRPFRQVFYVSDLWRTRLPIPQFLCNTYHWLMKDVLVWFSMDLFWCSPVACLKMAQELGGSRVQGLKRALLYGHHKMGWFTGEAWWCLNVSIQTDGRQVGRQLTGDDWLTLKCVSGCKWCISPRSPFLKEPLPHIACKAVKCSFWDSRPEWSLLPYKGTPPHSSQSQWCWRWLENQAKSETTRLGI